MSLEETLATYFAQAFDAITADHEPHDIAGLGAFTDDDAQSIVFVAHSRAHEQSQISEDPDFATDAVWGVFEWDLPLDSNEVHTQAEARANAAIAGLNSRDVASHRAYVWKSALNALGTLADQGYFERWPDAIRVFMVADGVNEEEQLDWNVALNGPERAPAVQEYFGE